jgi:hypothetical protein
MKENLIYFALFLILAYVFVLMVLRGIYYTFVLKKEPLESLKVIPKIRFKIKKGSLLDKAKQEERKEKMSRWG